MKTPMQEMLEWVRATLPMDLDFPQMIERKIESLLEKEKEQIMDAHKHGFSEGIVFGSNPIYRYKTSEQYYNETFNTKEK